MDNDVMPDDLRQLFLAHTAHMPVKLCHMYAVWKINKPTTRPIVPSYAAPTTAVLRWPHEQLFLNMIEIPTV